MTTQEKSKENALQLIKEMNMTFPIVFDTGGKIQDQFRIQAFPTSYFIDSKGIIQQVSLASFPMRILL